jgi:DNA-directed RNA polymerase specialized sigma24 family protein
MIEQDKSELVDLLDRLVSTTQDVFIFQALEAGMSVRQIASMVRVNTDRVTRISKLRPKRTGIKVTE